MRIRRARWWELREIGKMYADAYEPYGYDWDDKPAIELVKKYFHTQKDLFFVMYEPGVGVVGAIWGNILIVSNQKYLDDVDVWVDPEYQNKGIAKNLLKHLFKIALRKYKISFIQFLADSKRKFPMEYYKKLGFRDSTWINMTGEPEEVLEKLK